MKSRMIQIVIALGLMAATVMTQASVLPEFMNARQLAAWRAQHSAPSVTVAQAPDEQPVFFTGKPYDAASGTYLFKYRSYSPTLARWTSADPSGFPDGANNHVYVNNAVATCLDRLGRDIYNLNIPTAANNFGHSGMLVGNDQGGYDYYSWGPSTPGSRYTSPGTLSQDHYDNLADAMAGARSDGCSA